MRPQVSNTPSRQIQAISESSPSPKSQVPSPIVNNSLNSHGNPRRIALHASESCIQVAPCTTTRSAYSLQVQRGISSGTLKPYISCTISFPVSPSHLFTPIALERRSVALSRRTTLYSTFQQNSLITAPDFDFNIIFSYHC